MILSEHASKGNGDKLVEEFLSTLESPFECYVYEVGSRQADDASARDNLIYFVMQPVSYSFACHVSCKVKYFGKVANV